ncbi:uncharacterized protein EV422DRAFT_512570 [Fimicolochytrium jonesii]|uniref:uncharacterized protein n=1 Tax=Fimicolochytrium jonesii TaxID=1396493 RepID=UPI0022FE559A|nr:uncharacterized protein EV422DRAFT_512570 [Fimicolochytrium jonesii]KAI8827084.1 hypothetical protein EV422DRAFT_512570 [Fimicolochytrium jonesii]
MLAAHSEAPPAAPSFLGNSRRPDIGGRLRQSAMPDDDFPDQSRAAIFADACKFRSIYGLSHISCLGIVPHVAPLSFLRTYLLRPVSTGRFSDIMLIAHNQVYRLHRVILIQSPFFRRMLLDQTGKEVVVVEGSMGIEMGGDWRVAKEGMDLSLRDLYIPPSYRPKHVTYRNALTVLPAACYLELSSLSHFCVDVVLKTLSTETVVDYASQLERLRPSPRGITSPYGPNHQYAKLFRDCYTELYDAILCFICGVINSGLSSEDAVASAQWEGEQEVEQDKRSIAAEQLLAKLPLCWIRRVLESDLLSVPNEFERYELIKRVVKMRRVKTTIEERSFKRENSYEPQDEIDVSVWSEAETGSIGQRDIPAAAQADVVTRNALAAESVFRLRNYVGRLFGRGAQTAEAASPTGNPAQRKRKRSGSDVENDHPSADEDEFVDAPEAAGISTPRPARFVRRTPVLRSPARTPTSSMSHNQSYNTSTIVHTHYGLGTLPSSAGASAEDTVMAGIFQTAVVYTYMTFPQLELVKQDGIVPDAVVLESFWLQAQLMNGGTGGTSGLGASMRPLGSIGNGFMQQGRRGGPVGAPHNATNFGKYRFAIEFKNVQEYFLGPAQPGRSRHGKEPSLYPTVEEVTEARKAKSARSATVMTSESVICAGLHYRVLLSLCTEDEVEEAGIDENEECDALDDSRSSPAKRGDAPATSKKQAPRLMLRALLQRNKIVDKRAQKQAATTDENGAGPSTSSGAAPPNLSSSSTTPAISYRIHLFNPRDFNVDPAPPSTSDILTADITGPPARAGTVNPPAAGPSSSTAPSTMTINKQFNRWRRFGKPVTKCDFDGDGFVKGVPLSDVVAGGGTGDAVELAGAAVGGKNAGSKDTVGGDLWAIVVIEFK